VAVARTSTLLPLDRFAEVIGVHPLHFNQVVLDDLPMCGRAIKQYSWQSSDRTGREDIARVIREAEDTVLRYAGFTPAPSWVADERQEAVAYFDPTLRASYIDLKGYPRSVRLNRKLYISGGKRNTSLIAAARPITYSDPDGDGYNERATITATTSVTDTDEIAVFYPGSTTLQVRPITVTIAAGTATIVCSRHQLVLQSKLDALSPTDLLGTDNANFLTTVDVWRVYNDPSQQGLMQWRPLASCDCTTDSVCPSCELSGQTACLLAANARLSWVSYQPADWDSDESEWTATASPYARDADSIRFWYRAGLKYGTSMLSMDPQWEFAISMYALSLLDRPLCGCDALTELQSAWSVDLAKRVSGSEGSTNFAPIHAINNPIGTTKAAIHLWRLVEKEIVDA